MLELLPPPSWWRDDRIAGAVNLTTDQVASLDKVYSEQGDDIARLINDSQVAVRQLRDSLALDQPKSEDIGSAGQRLRTLRDDIFDRQLRMLAAERLLLSTQQWTALQNALQNARSQRQERGGYPGGRGRGGRGGRRPGWGY
jgi:Spy/CpxP family protein refolding chaperone